MIVLQLVVNGVLLGGVLALSALGFNVIFGVMRVVNLAHGDFVVIAAVFCAWAFAQFGINPLLLLPLTIAVGFGAVAHLDLRLVVLLGRRGLDDLRRPVRLGAVPDRRLSLRRPLDSAGAPAGVRRRGRAL